MLAAPAMRSSSHLPLLALPLMAAALGGCASSPGEERAPLGPVAQSDRDLRRRERRARRF